MSSLYEDWADWAGDHPEQAEADLREARRKAAPTCSSCGAPARTDYAYSATVCEQWPLCIPPTIEKEK